MQCRHCHRDHRAQAFYCGHCGRRLSELPGATPPLPPPLDPQYLRPGSRLGSSGRYLITAQLGEGGFGQVYRAIDLELYERECVIKRLVIRQQLSPDLLDQVIESFTREAQLLSALSTPGHPAIPNIYEHLIDQHCLVMQYVAGESLGARLARQVGGLTQEEVLIVGRAVCSALAYLHRQPGRSVLHRDVKPDNILRDHEGRIWLIDFGLSKALPVALIATEEDAVSMGGTAGYTPPEQLHGMAEPRSDVYALAMTLVRLLTNASLPSTPPGVATVAELLPTTLRPELRALLLRGVTLEAARRPSADAFLAALNAIDQDLAPPSPPAPLALESAFVGRAAELADLGRRLQQRRIVALTGFAGVGKTTLAAHLAAQSGPNMIVFLYHCSADTGIDKFIRQLAEFLAWHGRPTLWHTFQRQAIHTSVAAAAPVEVEVALAALADQEVLICIDDAHHVAGQAAFERLFKGLSRLAHAGQARVLITARQRPDGIARQDCAQLAGLNAEDARTLLAQHAATLPEVLSDQIYHLTEGNPQLLVLSLDLLQHGDDPKHLIARLHQAPSVSDYLLREVHGHLSKTEQSVMGGLAVLDDDGASQEVLEAVLDLGSLQALLIGLEQRQLLRVRATDGAPIYTQHALVRAFYQAALTLPDRRQIHRRASTYYERDAQNPLPAALHAYEAREISRCAALLTPDVQRFLFAGEATLVRRLLDALSTHIALHPEALAPTERIGLHLALGEAAAFAGQRAAAQREFAAALALHAASAASDRRQEVRACRGMAKLLESKQPQEALEWLERGHAALDPADQLERARLGNRIGSIQHQLGRFPEARAVLQEALAGLPVDQVRLRADLLVNLGISCAATGAYDAGREHLREALAAMRRIGNRWAEVGILHDLGMILEITGDWDAAESHYRQTLQLAEELGGGSHRCDMLLALGILQTNRGQYTDAEQYLAQSLTLADEQQARVSAVHIRSSLADLYLRMGRLADATQMAAHAASLAEELGARSQVPEILRTQALIALAEDRQTIARDHAERALALAREQASPEDEGQGLRVRAEVGLADGDPDGALADCATSAALLVANPYQHAQTLLVWSRALAASGDADGAAHLTAQAQGTLARLGVVPRARR